MFVEYISFYTQCWKNTTIDITLGAHLTIKQCIGTRRSTLSLLSHRLPCLVIRTTIWPPAAVGMHHPVPSSSSLFLDWL